MQSAGRDDPCACGSGKKFGHCHGAGAAQTGLQQARPAAAPAQTVSALLEQGTELQRAGRFSEAERVYQAILQADPDCALALEHLGVLALQVSNAQAALPLLRRAVEVGPSRASAHFNHGGALLALHRLRDAAACFERARVIDPRLAEAHNNLGNIYKYFDIDRALACYRQAVDARPLDAASHSNLLVCLHFSAACSHEQMFAEHLRWAQRHAQRYYPQAPRYANAADPERALRIGFVSSNFTGLVIGHFLRAVFAALDQSRYALYCYSSTPSLDALGAELRAQTRVWRDISALDDDAAAALVRSDEIDILVDLAGHMTGNRLLIFARKPAPIQVAWLDYFDTTGLETMDYLLTDPVTSPADSRQRFTEKLLHLPASRFCFTPLAAAPMPAPPPMLKNGYVSFGSFNRIDKINAQVIAAWAEILRQTPGARLVLKNVALTVPDLAEHCRERFAAYGIGAERLELRAPSAHREMLAEYADIDIALDTFPYNGGATSLDALWMGVPIVALAGERMIARQTAAMLACVGLQEFIAHSVGQYVELAVRKALELERLREIRAGLRGRMRASPLCDAPRFARDLEDNFRLVWRRWCAERPTSKENVNAAS
jgi:protein O-GlcNAc transferase